jgi:nitronate monooxygenase
LRPDRWPTTRLGDELGIAYPIIQAPMASITTAPIVAAVCAAGGLGSLGSSVMSPERIASEVTRVRAATQAPFALNFFLHRPPRIDQAVFERMRQRLEPYRSELGVAELASHPVPPPFDDDMLERVLALAPAVVSFHFGVPSERALDALRAARIRVLASATNVDEARALDEAGVDAIVAQGAEAGGHRGTFDPDSTHGEIGTLALVPQIVDAVSVPVIAAGGIADGRGIAAVLTLGAQAAQLGTAFLACPEAEVEPLYRRTLLEPRAAHTRVTRLYTGRPARAIVTRYMEELRDEEGRTPDYPLQRVFSSQLAQAATAQGSPEFSSLWAGQAARLARALPAADLLRKLVEETDAVLARTHAG